MMMEVWKMSVAMPQSLVAVPVRVPSLYKLSMMMLMMLIMNMAVLVVEHFVHMLVLMSLGEMEP
jgi:hypothetical protein